MKRAHSNPTAIAATCVLWKDPQVCRPAAFGVRALPDEVSLASEVRRR